jgi:hypothetical protein
MTENIIFVVPANPHVAMLRSGYKRAGRERE